MGKTFAQYAKDTMGKAGAIAVKVADKSGLTDFAGSLNGANREIESANVSSGISAMKFEKLKKANDAKKAQMRAQAEMDAGAEKAKNSTYKRKAGDANWEGSGGKAK